MKHILNIVITLFTLCLIGWCVSVVLTPIRFNRQKKVRDFLVEQRLFRIRDAQVAYSTQHGGAYCSNWSELIRFVKTAKLPRVQNQDGKADTIWVSLKDSIFPKDFSVDSLKYVPFGSGITFELATKEYCLKTGGKYYLFQAQTLFNVYLYGLDADELNDLNEVQKGLGKYCGLRIGSVDAPNGNKGNWE